MPAEQEGARALQFNAGLTLSARRRVRHHLEFKKIFLSRKQTNKWFIVYVRKNEKGFSRLGIVASKKTMPKATSRNLVKRLIRETFRCGFQKGCALDVVVQAKRIINQENRAEGRLALEQLLQAVSV